MQRRVRNFQTFLMARSPMRISINYDDTVRERGKHLCRFRWHRNARIRRFGVYAASIRNVNIYATTQLSVWSEKRLFTLSYALHRSAARFRFRHERSVCARAVATFPAQLPDVSTFFALYDENAQKIINCTMISRRAGKTRFSFRLDWLESRGQVSCNVFRRFRFSCISWSMLA